MQESSVPEACLLEARQPSPKLGKVIRFDESVSPEYIERLLEFTGLTLADDAFHDTRLMLEQALGMLQLRVADSVTARAIAEVSEDEDEDGEISSADGDDDDAPTAGGDACDRPAR